MAKAFSTLEKNILKSKGLSDAQLKKLAKAGINSREDFKTVGDPATLAELVAGITKDAAAAVIAWATGGAGGGGSVVVESADAVYCIHCRTKQPKDYNSGDICVSCGKQAEPILACYWCSSSGPGKFCRQCGAEFVATSELDLDRFDDSERNASRAAVLEPTFAEAYTTRAMARASLGNREGALADAARELTGSLGLIPLRWALACLLIDLATTDGRAAELRGIRDDCARRVEHWGGTWRRT